MNPNKNYIIFNKGKQSMDLKQHSSGFFFLVSRNLIQQPLENCLQIGLVKLIRKFYSDLWQYRSLRVFNSSISVLFWFSNTATRFSKHLTYSFFFRLHSFAASLEDREKSQCQKETRVLVSQGSTQKHVSPFVLLSCQLFNLSLP